MSRCRRWCKRLWRTSSALMPGAEHAHLMPMCWRWVLRRPSPEKASREAVKPSILKPRAGPVAPRPFYEVPRSYNTPKARRSAPARDGTMRRWDNEHTRAVRSDRSCWPDLRSFARQRRLRSDVVFALRPTSLKMHRRFLPARDS